MNAAPDGRLIGTVRRRGADAAAGAGEEDVHAPALSLRADAKQSRKMGSREDAKNAKVQFFFFRRLRYFA